jgi:hypothetical protein
MLADVLTFLKLATSLTGHQNLFFPTKQRTDRLIAFAEPIKKTKIWALLFWEHIIGEYECSGYAVLFDSAFERAHKHAHLCKWACKDEGKSEVKTCWNC